MTVKERKLTMECPDDSLVIPRPMLFHENDFVMPFLKKTYNMVDDPSTDAIVSWSSTHNSFIVWDLQKLSDDLLPKYFKHRNFASFTRQLNTYGFRKTDCERWEFANECFLKGQKHLLRNIKRKSNPHLQQQHQARDQQEGQHIDMNQHQQEGKQKAKQQKMEGEPKGSKSHDDLQQFELKQLKRDRDVNVIEIFNLKQQQEGIEQKLRDIERKQHQIMMLMARAIQNPTFSRNFSR